MPKPFLPNDSSEQAAIQADKSMFKVTDKRIRLIILNVVLNKLKVR